MDSSNSGEVHPKRPPDPSPIPSPTSSPPTQPQPLMNLELRKTEVFPPLVNNRIDTTLQTIWQTESQGWSRFLVISPLNKEDNLTKLSPFRILNSIKSTGMKNTPRKVSKQGSGCILVEVKDSADSTQLQSCKELAGIQVKVEPHRTLNSSKGVVKSRELQGSTEEEMVQYISGVTHARCIKVRRDGKEIPTNTWILTFNSATPPSRICIEGYMILEVRPFIEKPRRCFNCHRFGHTQLKCRSKSKLCKNCGKPEETDHLDTNGTCPFAAYCPNCRQDGHTALDKDCPKFKQEKAILEHKSMYGGTFAQARAILFPNNIRPTYSQAAKSTAQKTETNSSSLIKKTNVQQKHQTPDKNETSRPGIITKNRFQALQNNEDLDPHNEGAEKVSPSPSKSPSEDSPLQESEMETASSSILSGSWLASAPPNSHQPPEPPPVPPPKPKIPPKPTLHPPSNPDPLDINLVNTLNQKLVLKKQTVKRLEKPCPLSKKKDKDKKS